MAKQTPKTEEQRDEQPMGNDEADYSSLGLRQEQETDRFLIDEKDKKTLEPIRITRIRFDAKTRYFKGTDEDAQNGTGEGTPIVKIDGINMEDEPVKLRSLSDVLYHNMLDVIGAVGAREEKDEKNILWFVLKKKVRVDGFEPVRTEKGKNPYYRVKVNNPSQ